MRWMLWLQMLDEVGRLPKDGHIARAAILHAWPYCTRGQTARVAKLHALPYSTRAVWPFRLWNTATRAIRPRVQCGHACSMTTRAMRPRVQCGHACNTAMRAIRPRVQCGHACNTAMRAIWPRVQYGHACNVAILRPAGDSPMAQGAGQRRRRQHISYGYILVMVTY